VLLDRYPAVIFDLFHTLTSSAVLHKTKGTGEILGVSREAWNDQLLLYSEDRLRGKTRDQYEIIRKMAHAIDPVISDALIRRAASNRIKRFRYALAHIERSTLDMLEQLRDRGKVLGLISNGDVNEFAGWQTSPLRKYFPCAIFSCDVGFIKPEREIYELCMEKLGVHPADSLYIGDGGSDELGGAKAFGMTTVITIRVIKDLWPEKIGMRRRDADHEIDTWDDLFGLP
jgi:putative hydrolase of the HAD superfamily